MLPSYYGLILLAMLVAGGDAYVSRYSAAIGINSVRATGKATSKAAALSPLTSHVVQSGLLFSRVKLDSLSGISPADFHIDSAEVGLKFDAFLGSIKHLSQGAADSARSYVSVIDSYRNSIDFDAINTSSIAAFSNWVGNVIQIVVSAIAAATAYLQGALKAVVTAFKSIDFSFIADLVQSTVSAISALAIAVLNVLQAASGAFADILRSIDYAVIGRTLHAAGSTLASLSGTVGGVLFSGVSSLQSFVSGSVAAGLTKLGHTVSAFPPIAKGFLVAPISQKAAIVAVPVVIIAVISLAAYLKQRDTGNRDDDQKHAVSASLIGESSSTSTTSIDEPFLLSTQAITSAAAATPPLVGVAETSSVSTASSADISVSVPSTATTAVLKEAAAAAESSGTTGKRSKPTGGGLFSSFSFSFSKSPSIPTKNADPSPPSTTATAATAATTTATTWSPSKMVSKSAILTPTSANPSSLSIDDEAMAAARKIVEKRIQEMEAEEASRRSKLLLASSAVEESSVVVPVTVTDVDTGFSSSLVTTTVEEEEVKEVVVEKEEIDPETQARASAIASTLTAGIVGLKIGGPIGFLAAAAYAHYEVRKKDDELVGKVLRGVGDTVVGGVELLKKVDSKFEVVREVEKILLGAVVTTTYGDDEKLLQDFRRKLDTTIARVGEEIIPAIVQASDAALEITDSVIEKAEKLIATTTSSTQQSGGSTNDHTKEK